MLVASISYLYLFAMSRTIADAVPSDRGVTLVRRIATEMSCLISATGMLIDTLKSRLAVLPFASVAVTVTFAVTSLMRSTPSAAGFGYGPWKMSRRTSSV